MKIKHRFLTLAACIAMVGCSPLAPRPNYSTFFILTPISSESRPDPTAGSTKGDSALVIGLGPIDFPDYLRRPQVATLAAPGQIDLSEQMRWAEPLDKNFARVLAENLAQLLNTQRIEKYPWSRKAQVNYEIAIDVLSFETTVDGQSQLSARWIIKDGQSGKDLYASETRVSTPIASGETGVPTALSNDLATLSRDIASRVTELSQHRPPSMTAIEIPQSGQGFSNRRRPSHRPS
jgi:uncharacterized protein